MELKGKNISLKLDARDGFFSLIYDSGKAAVQNARVVGEFDGQQVNVSDFRVSNRNEHLENTIGEVERVLLSARSGELQLKLQVDVYAERSWIGLQARIKNRSKKAVSIGKFQIVDVEAACGGVLRLGAHPAEYRVLVESGASGNYTGVRSIVSNGGLHESRHLSILYSPSDKIALLAGQGTIEETWVKVLTKYGEKDYLGNYTYAHKPNIDGWHIECDFAEYSLDPGEEIQSDYIILGFDSNPFQLIENYAEAVCILNNVRKFTKEEIPVGWMSWYNQDSHLKGGCGNARGAAQESITLEQAKFIKEHLKDYGVTLIEIDEGYERTIGDWRANKYFPSGMDGVARKIKALGLKPGIWIAPFMVAETTDVARHHPDWFVQGKDCKPFPFFDWPMVPPHDTIYAPDPTHPEVEKWLRKLYQGFAKSGYVFFKNDFVDWIGVTNAEFHNKKVCRGLKLWRSGFKIIREAVGPNAHIQPCSGPTIAGVGIVDSARIEMDLGGGVNQRQWDALKNIARGIACKYYQNRRFFINDPDNLHTAEYEQFKRYPSKAVYKHTLGLLKHETQVRAAVAVLCGGALFLGDRLTLLGEEQLDVIKKCLPVYGEAARPIDMFEEEYPRIWVLDVKKRWDSWKIVSLFNWDNESRVVSVAADELNLDESKSYLVWEFWGSEFLGEFGNCIKLAVKPHSNKLLRITEKRFYPQLIGTDMHLIQGGVEIDNVDCKAGKDGRLSLLTGTARRPKGARGKLFFHVPDEFKLKSAKLNGRTAEMQKLSKNIVHLSLEFEKELINWQVSFSQMSR